MSLVSLKTMVHASLAELGPCWDDVLPDGLPKNLDMSNFSLQAIDDDPTSRKSLFDRPGNQAFLRSTLMPFGIFCLVGPHQTHHQ